jgi:hypothetical protein
MTDELLAIDALMKDTSPEGNARRHRRMMMLYMEARRQRRQGDFALADQLKTAGNRLHAQNSRGALGLRTLLDAG